MDDLIRLLVREHPRLSGIADHVQVAVNQEYVPRSHTLTGGDEVALIPPVSGGAVPRPVRVVEDPIRPQDLHEIVRTDGDGAVVTFSGVVRNHTGRERTSHLIYEAYAPMAERKMAEIVDRARARWPVGQIAIQHRVGRLEVGDISVQASVASPHRGEAFNACRHVIDCLKDEVPVWKKEVGPGGSYWVEGPRQGSQTEAV